jgi:hypothetical protein
MIHGNMLPLRRLRPFRLIASLMANRYQTAGAPSFNARAIGRDMALRDYPSRWPPATSR